MVNITCFGGVDEIGGNRILVEDGRSRLFLDFGKSFSREKDFFEEPYLAPRKIEHLRALELIPSIAGLYAGDEDSFELDGVLISHAHMDHYDNARLLKDGYPIYGSPVTLGLIMAREWSSRGNCMGSFGRCTQREPNAVSKDMRPLVPGMESEVGDMKVTVYPVDHSVPGAVSTVLETSEGCIVYSGDIRLHGRGATDTEKFIEAASKTDPELLLLEGTHIGDSKVESEEEVGSKTASVVARSTGLVMAGFAIADAQRLRTFREVARGAERKLVLSARQAYIAKRLHERSPESSIDILDDDIYIFVREKQRSLEYEKQLMAECPESKLLGADDVRADQKSFILVASYYDMNEIGRIRPAVGSVYIHSSSEPFEEEMEISYERLHNWLDHLGVPLVQIHASGHAGPFDLKDIIRRIAPRKVVPIHTSSSALFKSFMSDLNIDVQLAERESPLTLR